MRRKPPTSAYVPNDRILVLHPAVVDALRDVADGYVDDEFEWCVLLYGTLKDAVAAVEFVVVPEQDNHPTYYNVSGDAMAAAAAAVDDRLLVGQVHAHPGIDVEHSPVDDAKAASRKAVSIVLPHYGITLPAIDGIGVHDYQQNYWYLLPPALSSLRVRLDPTAPVPAIKDLR